jgi:hypothetical protein
MQRLQVRVLIPHQQFALVSVLEYQGCRMVAVLATEHIRVRRFGVCEIAL